MTGSHPLMQGLRAGDAATWRDADAHLRPMLTRFAEERYANALDAARVAVADVVTDTLTDFAERVTVRGLPIPTHLHAYLRTALKHRILNAQRAAARRERRERRAADGHARGDRPPVAARQVADTLGISVAAAEKRIQRARRRTVSTHRGMDDHVGPSVVPGQLTLFFYAPVPDEVALDFHAMKAAVIERCERDYLTQLVQHARGNLSQAARVARIDRVTLYRLLDRHGLRPLAARVRYAC